MAGQTYCPSPKSSHPLPGARTTTGGVVVAAETIRHRPTLHLAVGPELVAEYI
jgi:hypothetical protein